MKKIVLLLLMIFATQACASPAIDYMVLVNKTHPLPDGWEEALETVHTKNSVGDDVEVEKKAYDAYLKLKDDLLKNDGIEIELDSARRSVAEQKDIMARFTEKYGADYAAKTVATPGYSEHHTGLALDLYFRLDGKDVYYNEDLVKYPEIWAKIHAKLPKYGFILRYLEGKEKITGYSYEPWHIRYIDDPELAKRITDSKLTLEEWLERKSAPKVILDADVAYLNDDALAMFVLEQADKAGMVNFLGVTIAGGNAFLPEATTAALRQLEMIGRPDIPVYQGTDEPLAGFRNMREEAKLYGMPTFCGAYWDFQANDFADLSKRSRDYLHLDIEPLHGYPETRAKELPAWDFIIESVKENPGEVTIMAIGPATNIALALKKYPALAEEAAGIIYMGGDIDVPGNTTPAAEFNWFYDPDAIKLCLSANWKKQTVVPDDLAQSIHLTQKFYDRLAEHNTNAITRLILSDDKTFTSSEADYVWDAAVPVLFLKPDLIADLQRRYITVDNTPGADSGRALTWKQYSPEIPEGVKKVDIVMAIDTPLFWDFYIKMLTLD